MDETTSLNDTVKNSNNVVYRYFKDYYSLTSAKNSVDVTLHKKYYNKYKSLLKSALRNFVHKATKFAMYESCFVVNCQRQQIMILQRWIMTVRSRKIVDPTVNVT